MTKQLTTNRGNLFLYDDEKDQAYNYDNNKKIDIPHTCRNCKKEMKEDEPDACIGKLPGVKYACCGHGIIVDAYVVFNDNTLLRASEAIVYFEIIKKRIKCKVESDTSKAER